MRYLPCAITPRGLPRASFGCRAATLGVVPPHVATYTTATTGDSPPYSVIFVRHGQSAWNKANRFMGWMDIDLTPEGLQEAAQAGRTIAAKKTVFDECHTSRLKRCIKTSMIMLEETNHMHIPLICHWRLNERSYGALVGRNKKELVAIYGPEQVKLWRRSYDTRPPPVELESPYYPGHEHHKYQDCQEGEIPLSESLCDVKKRTSRYWDEVLVPRIKSGKRILVCSHENALRSLFMHIDKISPQDIPTLEIPRAVPVQYDFDADMKPIRRRDAKGLISGSFWANESLLHVINERDQRQVYDLNIKVNLEEVSMKEAVNLMQQSQSPLRAVPLGGMPQLKTLPFKDRACA